MAPARAAGGAAEARADARDRGGRRAAHRRRRPRRHPAREPAPRLVFLSACRSTAAADQAASLGGPDAKHGRDGAGTRERVAHSLATALVDAGVPAVLG